MIDRDNYEIDFDKILNECAKCPELYNKVSNALYKKLNIHSAELSLVITVIVKEVLDHESK